MLGIGRFGGKPMERHARLFRNGRNQALRIPREFELPGEEVIMYREDGRLIIEPVTKPRTLADILPNLEAVDEKFPQLDDPPVADQDIF
jgi:antitoxin VapB